MNEATLEVPQLGIVLHPGDKIRLGQFSRIRWIVGYGWFKFGNNRAINGWYLTNAADAQDVRPIQQIDLCDIVVVSSTAQ